MSEAVRAHRIVVVGGGISGLATAHALLGAGLDVVVLEAEEHLGGNIRTKRVEGFVLDEGPDSWVANKPHMTALVKALGLADDLIETVPANRKVYVKTDAGKLIPLPDGMMLGIPTKLMPLVTTPLLSWRGKLRAGLDLFLPVGFGRIGGEDEPLGEFVERRLGREVLDRLAGPLLGGLFAGEVSELSLLGTFPQLAALEKEGGLIRGSLALARKAPKRPAGEKPSTFLTLRGGLGQVVEALAAKLGDRVLRSARVQSIEKRDSSANARFRVVHERGEEAAEHVVLAGPAHVAASLVRSLSEPLARELDAIPYGSAATVFLAYDREDVPHPLDATGYLVPRKSKGGPAASTWVSSKWPDRAPEGRVLLRVFFGGGDVSKGEQELLAMARAEVRETLGVTVEPTLVHVARFERASPQPLVGHPARLRRIASALEQVGNLHVLGSAFDGVGLGDCVRQAQAIASKIGALRMRW